MTLHEYLTEPITWGGLPATRAEVISTMQQQGFSRSEIDWHLAGLDSYFERQRRQA